MGIELNGCTAGHVKTFCPFCHERRHDQRDKSLSVDIDRGLYKCHYCGAQGYVPDGDEERRNEERRKMREFRQGVKPVKGDFVRPVWRPEFLVENVMASSVVSEGNRQLRDLVTYVRDGRKISMETMVRFRMTVQWRQVHREDGSGVMVPVIGFNYFDRGVFINCKTRSLDKRFEFVARAELIPYNIDAILRKDVCYVTEGEFDCMTMVQCGFAETVSVPNGAQRNLSFLDRFVETHFEDKRLIVLALDCDGKGCMLRGELLRRFGEERCRVVRWSDGCKDANEELQRNGVEGVRARVEAAEEIPMSGIQTVGDVEGSLDELFRNGKQHGAGMGLGNLDRLITFETGRYMVVTGRPGDGKSEFVDEMCLRLCLLHGWKVAYFSPENTPVTYHLAKLAEKLTGYAFQNRGRMSMELYGGCKKWLSENVCHVLPGCEFEGVGEGFDVGFGRAVEDGSDRFTLSNVLEKARQAIARRGVRTVVIDPLNSIEPESGMEDLRWDRMVNAELRRFARKYRCLVILVAHPRKVNRASLDGRKRRVEMNDINGSADFGNMSDFCISVDRDDDLKVVTVYVDKVKFKHLGTRGQYHLHYDELSGRYVPCVLEKVPKDVEPALGNVEGRPGTACVRSSAGVKFFKTVDWRGFNVRWVNENGEVLLGR